MRFCFLQRVGHPAPAAVQPSISTIHCKTLNNFIKACYSLAVFVESNPRPFTLSPEGSPDRPVPTLSGRSRPARDRRFRPGRKGLVSLQFTSPVFLLTDDCPLITAHSCSKSFSCNTYGPPRKCCKQKTYGQGKSLRCNTYKKPGVGVFFQFWNSSPSRIQLSFQPLTRCPFRKPFLLIYIHLMGCVYPPPYLLSSSKLRLSLVVKWRTPLRLAILAGTQHAAPQLGVMLTTRGPALCRRTISKPRSKLPRKPAKS